jgi:XTP/dITP diphosphohydrolase
VTARIVLLVTSPRLPAGLLTAAAWDLVRAHPVFAAADGEQAAALRAAGVAVTPVDPDPEALVRALAAHDSIVWLGGPAGDEDFARRLGMRLAREPALAELELMYGSWDPPGARLLDAVAVMDRLVSPGGDPWKQQQTHASLAPYLLEESYEAYDAIAAGDLDALREELGDVLLQVLFHARVAQEAPNGFDIDAVATELVTKLVGRHPHVFAGSEKVRTAADQEIRWEQLKGAEKRRASSIDGVALAQPAVALAAKLAARTAKAALPVDLLPDHGSGTGGALFALSATARLAGEDPEGALRCVARRFADDVRAAEDSARAAGLDVGSLTPQQWREHWPR